jgi:hypothetical protein
VNDPDYCEDSHIFGEHPWRAPRGQRMWRTRRRVGGEAALHTPPWLGETIELDPGTRVRLDDVHEYEQASMRLIAYRFKVLDGRQAGHCWHTTTVRYAADAGGEAPPSDAFEPLPSA